MAKKMRYDMGPRQRAMFKSAQERAKRLQQEVEGVFAHQVKLQREGGEPSSELSEKIARLRKDVRAAQAEAKRIRQMPRFENVAPLRFSLGGQISQVRKHLG